jgi:hypothetical protein
LKTWRGDYNKATVCSLLNIMLPTTSKWFSYFVYEVLDRQSVCCCITGEEAGKEKEKVTSMENQIAKAHNLVESIYDKTF